MAGLRGIDADGKSIGVRRNARDVLPLCGAHDHATGVVKERMEMMESMAKRMKSMRERVDRNGYLAAIKSEAEARASKAPHLVHLFTPGAEGIGAAVLRL